jgi:16S rRNA G966 N2-methylase RsmD
MSDIKLTQFVQRHLNDDPLQLVLKQSGKNPDINIKYAATQISALQRMKNKVPNWYRPDLRFSSLLAVEQCSSQATAMFKAQFVDQKTVLDLSGGLGVDAAFMAAQAKELVYVEPNAALFEHAKKNFMTLGLKNITCINATATEALKQLSANFDTIYLDPDRRDGAGKKVFDFSDCSPDLIAIKDQLMTRCKQLLVKASPMLDINRGLKQLETVQNCYVIGWQDECKELIFDIGHNVLHNLKDTPIHAVTVSELGEARMIYTCTIGEEEETEIAYHLPQIFIYDPPPEILKAGILKNLARYFGLNKIHPNTHLFTSDQYISGVPGRTFVLKAVCHARVDDLKEYLPKAKANLRARNFPENTEALRKQLRIKDGGDIYLFAVTLADESLRVLVCNRLIGE